MKKTKAKDSPGTLYVVATPIGNSQDWTERAKSILSQVKIVAAEDTRVLKKELAKVKIKPKAVLSHHNMNEGASTKGLIEELQKGSDIALTTDAGTPLISDPGYRVVNAARQAGFKIVPIPGASSLTCALSVAALGGEDAYFGGFLPPKADARKKKLQNSKKKADTLVFFEAPHRLREALSDAEEIFGPDTETVICREMTKSYEEIQSGALKELRKYFATNEPRGEFVLLFKGQKIEQLTPEETEKEVEKLLSAGHTASDIIEELQDVTALNRKQLYDLIIRHKKSDL